MVFWRCLVVVLAAVLSRATVTMSSSAVLDFHAEREQPIDPRIADTYWWLRSIQVPYKGHRRVTDALAVSEALCALMFYRVVVV